MSCERTVIDGIHRLDGVLPLNERISLYRAIAKTTSCEAIARHFFTSADDLAAAEETIGQRLLDFRRRAGGQGSTPTKG